MTGRKRNDILNGHSGKRNEKKSQTKRKKNEKNMLTIKNKFGILMEQLAKKRSKERMISEN